MKRFCAYVLLALGMIALLAVNSQAQVKFPTTVSGVAVGAELRGPNEGEMWTLAWAGIRMPIGSILPKFDDGTKALYAVGQWGDVNDPDAGGLGGKVVLVGKTWVPHVFFHTGVGWLPGIAQEGETVEEGLTLDMGFTVEMSRAMNFFVHGMAMDRGPQFSADLFVGFGLDL